MKNTLPAQTVPAFLSSLRDPLRRFFASKNYTVSGEVLQVNPWDGNIYVVIAGKDEKRTQSITVFIRESVLARSDFIPFEGMELQVTGTIGLVRNEIQIYVDQMEEAGLGAMREMMLVWEKQYQALIYRQKRMIPEICRKIAVISASNSKGFADFKNHLSNGEIILYDCKMQGEQAAGEIASAIYQINQEGGYDCICIVRGGGSFTELFPYSMPEVLSAIGYSKIVVAVAVGHTGDSLLCDKVADESFSTPTALAKEMSDRKQRLIAGKKQALRERTIQENNNRRMIVGGIIIVALLGIIGYLLTK